MIWSFSTIAAPAERAKAQYVLRHRAQARDEVLVLAHRADQPAHGAAQPGEILTLGALLLRLDLQGQHVP